MKKVLIFLALIAILVLGLISFEGIALVIFLLVFVPLCLILSPLIFRIEKEEELTEEAKREKEGKFHKWE